MKRCEIGRSVGASRGEAIELDMRRCYIGPAYGRKTQRLGSSRGLSTNDFAGFQMFMQVSLVLAMLCHIVQYNLHSGARVRVSTTQLRYYASNEGCHPNSMTLLCSFSAHRRLCV